MTTWTTSWQTHSSDNVVSVRGSDPVDSHLPHHPPNDDNDDLLLPSRTRCVAAFSSSLAVFISYFIMSFYEDTSQNTQYSYECHLSSSTYSTPSTMMPLTMPLLRFSLGGNEYTFVFADEISNPRCFFSNGNLF